MRLLKFSWIVVVLVAPVWAGCDQLSQLDWGDWIATMTPTPVAVELSTSTATSTLMPTATPFTPLIVTATPVSEPACDGLSRPIRCVAEQCVVRNAQTGGHESVSYQVPFGTVLQALSLCECLACSPFQHWYWLGVDADGVSYWAVALDSVWREDGGY